MNPLVRSLKRIAAQVSRDRSFSFNHFLEHHGLEDVLVEADQQNYDAR